MHTTLAIETVTESYHVGDFLYKEQYGKAVNTELLNDKNGKKRERERERARANALEYKNEKHRNQPENILIPTKHAHFGRFTFESYKYSQTNTHTVTQKIFVVTECF